MMDRVKHYLSNPVFAAAALLAVLVVIGLSLWLILGSAEDDKNGAADDEASEDYSINTENDDPEDDQYALSGDDIVSIENNVSNVINTSGNFGVARSVLQGEFVPEEDLDEQTYTSRAESYNMVKDVFTDNSGYHYDESRVEGWEDDDSLGFEVFEDSILVSDMEGPVTVTRDGEESQAVDVTVSWEGRVFYYEVTATDTSWDGSFEVLEREYQENDAVFRLVETDQGWQIFSINDFGTEQFTSLWSSPSSEAIMNIDGFDLMGETEATREPLDEETLPPESDPTPTENPLDDQIESDIDSDFRDRMYSPPLGEDDQQG